MKKLLCILGIHWYKTEALTVVKHEYTRLTLDCDICINCGKNRQNNFFNKMVKMADYISK